MTERNPNPQPKIGKAERLKALLARDPGVLSCPVCGGALLFARETSALRCARGHSYDLAKKGYANLQGRGGDAKSVYSRALFESRRAVFGFGFYEEAARAITGIAKKHLRPSEAPIRSESAGAHRVLDAGCGEGYYAFMLSRDAQLRDACRFYGLDLSRDAVAMATDYDADIAWIVADLAKPPFRDGAFDLILNALSPAGYGAFRRILAPNGVLIKVLPGRDYLRELRALLGERGRGESEAAAHCAKHMRIAERANIRYRCALQAEQKKALPAMTPLTAGKNLDPSALDSLHCLTIDLEIVAGRPF
ncbi:MAG: methyltransferase domain-containing protein [Clostridiales Family XIII bacterium]|jgi:23S rRNA (guanine745-N1)-methyltransferase|nr:methyltransferase domain-containing protein [Clostridiales Family XIII bacterium]